MEDTKIKSKIQEPLSFSTNSQIAFNALGITVINFNRCNKNLNRSDMQVG